MDELQADRSALARVRPAVMDLVPELIDMRRDLHRHPEPGFEEHRTAGKVADWLAGCEGFRVRAGVAGTGVIADIGDPASGGPHVLLRADMDALRVEEANSDLDYCSIHPGLMHACGHDAHTAMLLGAARVLAQHRGALAGSVRLIFQPAEEGPGGAEPMIAEGALEGPRPDAAFALHVWSTLPLGHAALQPGPVMADTSELRITLAGRGGHGAAPQETIDPIVAAAHFITGLQTIVSRNVDPLDAAVLSIGKISGGSVMNAIAEEVTLDGTMRCYMPETRALLVSRLEDLGQGIDRFFRTRTRIEIIKRYPPVVNHPQMTQRGLLVLEQLLGSNRIRGLRLMGGEDMAFILHRVPGCFIFLGAGNSEQGADRPHHNPRFRIDEDVLPLGTELFLRLVEEVQGPLTSA